MTTTRRQARALKDAIAAVDALLFVTPEYNRAIPGRPEERHRLGSRPYGTNSFAHKPSAVIGASPGRSEPRSAQQSLRSALSFCNAPQMNAPEAYIQFTPGLITDDGEVTEASTEQFLRDYMEAFGAFVDPCPHCAAARALTATVEPMSGEGFVIKRTLGEL